MTETPRKNTREQVAWAGLAIAVGLLVVIGVSWLSGQGVVSDDLANKVTDRVLDGVEERVDEVFTDDTDDTDGTDTEAVPADGQ